MRHLICTPNVQSIEATGQHRRQRLSTCTWDVWSSGKRSPRVVQTHNQTRNHKGGTPLAPRHGSPGRVRRASLQTDSRSRRRPLGGTADPWACRGPPRVQEVALRNSNHGILKDVDAPQSQNCTSIQTPIRDSHRSKWIKKIKTMRTDDRLFRVWRECMHSGVIHSPLADQRVDSKLLD